DEKVERSADCFANMRDEFLKRYRTRQRTKPRPRTIVEMRRCISGKRFKDWEYKPITDITKQDVRNVLDSILDEGHDAHANKTLTVLKMLFNWAYDHDKITDVPTDRIKPPGAVTPRERTLTMPELVAVWNATYRDRGIDIHIHGDIVRILMLTGQRRNEVAGMQWSEIDFDRRTWELSRDRTKNKQPHIVPLSSAVLSILRRQLEDQKELGLESAHVFTTTGDTPFSGWSRSKQRLDQRCGVTDWRLHDLRRTVVTGMNDDLGIWPHVVEAVVNHVTGAAKRGVAGVYNRAEYLKERRRALERWARHLLKQVAAARRAA
nr:site-specific integrase [Denitromonas sp.]